MQQKALDRALRALAARPHTERELSEKLARAGFDEHIIAQVMQKLSEYRLLDDAGFAERYAASRARQGYGAAQIRQALRFKGVDAELASDAIAAVDEDEALSAATAVARKRRLETPDDRRRAIQALMRRGHSYSLAKQAVDAARAEETAETEA